MNKIYLLNKLFVLDKPFLIKEMREDETDVAIFIFFKKTIWCIHYNKYLLSVRISLWGAMPLIRLRF